MQPIHNIPEDRGRRQIADDRIPQLDEGPPIIIPPLPIPDIVVVALRHGIYPPHEEWVRELLRRSPYLNTPIVRRFLHGSLRIYMPRAQAREPNEGRCATCGSNWWGMPTIPHSTNQCPVPQQYRLVFQATNSRALCFGCRGQSEAHNWCRNVNEYCRQCREAGRGERRHHLISGICHLSDDEITERFRIYRIEYYRRVKEESEQEPFRIRFPNDEPLPEAPPAYNTYLGQKAMVVNAEATGGVEYTPASEYAGLVQISQREERERVDQTLLRLQRDFYKDPLTWAGATEEVRIQIQAHRDAIQRHNGRRLRIAGRRNQGNQQQEAAPEEGQQNAQQVPQHQGIPEQQAEAARGERQQEAPVAPQPQEPNGELNQVQEVVPQHQMDHQDEIAHRAVLQALQEETPASERQYVEFMLTTTMRTGALENLRIQIPPRVAANPEQQQARRQQGNPPQEINANWWITRAGKVRELSLVRLPMIKKLVINSGNLVTFRRPAEQRAQDQDHQFQVNMAVLRTVINDMVMDVDVDTQAAIPMLQRALSGSRNLPEVFERQENGNRGWLDDYYELLLSIGCVVVLSGRPVQTQMTGEHTEFIQAYGWRIPYVIPDVEFYLDTPQQHRLPFYKLLTASFAQQLDDDE
ncbi:hypothetical protein CRE_16118 [Caenorhabditis remanei]|uniref:Uncharacterized protein n=1 Tax=Caenorhabditis remanei TaxID=31234 RepID=E3MBX6_CAERE|nr:hypothetical protein CRE_16118 [Caenorhabditis remanei]